MHLVQLGEDGQLQVDHGGRLADQELPLLTHHGFHGDSHEHCDDSTSFDKHYKVFSLCENGFVVILKLIFLAKGSYPRIEGILSGQSSNLVVGKGGYKDVWLVVGENI